MSGKGKPFEMRSMTLQNPVKPCAMVQHIKHSLHLSEGDFLLVEGSQGELVTTPENFQELLAEWVKYPSKGLFTWCPCDALSIGVEIGAPTRGVPMKPIQNIVVKPLIYGLCIQDQVISGSALPI